MITETTMAKQLNDITECSICSDQFNDPRSLPCVHIFCLKCIERSGDGKKPGESASCPLCRKEFTVPVGGMGGLPKNFFMDKMVQIKRLSSIQVGTPGSCEACTVDGTIAFKNAPATAYCVDCQEKLCDECTKYHKKYKTTRSHKTVKLDDNDRPWNEELLSKSLSRSVCELHENQPLDICCRNCQALICVVCYKVVHRQHECADIKDVVKKLRKQMIADAARLTEEIGNLQEWLVSLEKRREGFRKCVGETKAEILRKADELKEIIERNTKDLLDELEIEPKKLDNLIEDITQRITIADSLKIYTEELCSKGSKSDIATGSSALHIRTEDLLNLDIIKQSVYDITECIEIKFKASNLITGFGDNVVGTVELNGRCVRRVKSRLVDIICHT